MNELAPRALWFSLLPRLERLSFIKNKNEKKFIGIFFISVAICRAIQWNLTTESFLNGRFVGKGGGMDNMDKVGTQ